MTLARLWAFLAVALPVLAALLAGLSSVDLTYHVRAGTQLLDTGAIPTTDTWTYTAAGASWLNQQWGAQLILGAVFRAAGWTGLALLRATLVGLTFGFLFEACRRSGLDLRRAAWLTIAAFCVAAVALALRPQLFGMALLTATLLLVVDRRAHPSGLWAVPLIVLAWANLHGSFFLGPMVLGLAWLQDLHDRSPQARRTLLVLGVSVGAACVTPFGPQVWLYAAGLTTNAFITSQITEWQPTSLRTIPGIVFFASVALVVALLARSGRATPWPTQVGLAAFAAIGAYAVRGMAWWPLGAAVLIAPLLRPAPERDPVGAAARSTRPERTPRLNIAVVAILVLAGVALLPVWRPIDPGLDAPAGLVVDAGRSRRRRSLEAHRRAPGDRPTGHEDPQSAAVGFVVRVRPAGRPRSRGLADRALPGGRVVDLADDSRRRPELADRARPVRDGRGGDRPSGDRLRRPAAGGRLEPGLRGRRWGDLRPVRNVRERLERAPWMSRRTGPRSARRD